MITKFKMFESVNEDTEFAGVMNCTNEEIENYLDNIEREKNIKTYNL